MTSDLSDYPIYVQEAAARVGLGQDALARARRGALWLDEHAPSDWRLQMISIKDGITSCHVHIAYGDQDPLALAFRTDKHLAGPDGRVLSQSVSRRFGLSHGDLVHLGFESTRRDTPDCVSIPAKVDARFLDEAWSSILSNMDWRPQPVRKHPAA